MESNFHIFRTGGSLVFASGKTARGEFNEELLLWRPQKNVCSFQGTPGLPFDVLHCTGSPTKPRGTCGCCCTTTAACLRRSRRRDLECKSMERVFDSNFTEKKNLLLSLLLPVAAHEYCEAPNKSCPDSQEEDFPYFLIDKSHSAPAACLCPSPAGVLAPAAE